MSFFFQQEQTMGFYMYITYVSLLEKAIQGSFLLENNGVRGGGIYRYNLLDSEMASINSLLCAGTFPFNDEIYIDDTFLANYRLPLYLVISTVQ